MRKPSPTVLHVKHMVNGIAWTVTALDRSNGHEWAKWEFTSMTLVCCNICGIVRRADDKNRPCKGKVKVGLRTAAWR